MFYPAGTLYALAEESYRLGLYGLCNTDHLCELYEQRYGGQGMSFEPAVDPTVFHAEGRNFDRTLDQVATVFVYARPGHWRNCWELAFDRARGAEARGSATASASSPPARGRRPTTSAAGSSTSACSTTAPRATSTARATSASRSRSRSTRRTCRSSSWPAACRWSRSTTPPGTGCCATARTACWRAAPSTRCATASSASCSTPSSAASWRATGCATSPSASAAGTRRSRSSTSTSPTPKAESRAVTSA